VPFVLKSYDATKALELIQYMMLILPGSYLHGHGLYNELFEALLDLTSCLADGLPRDEYKLLLNWSRDNIQKFLTSDGHFRRISTILPFQVHSPYLSNLVTNRGQSILEQHFKPWHWLPGEMKDALVKRAWNDKSQVEQFNDTCISLSYFGAEVLKPEVPRWRRIYDNGWWPSESTNDPLEDNPFEFNITLLDHPVKRKAEDTTDRKKARI
jgi:hypothetical protein